MIITIKNYKTPSRNKTVSSHWRTYMSARDAIAYEIITNAPSRQPIGNALVHIISYFTGKRAIDTSNIDDKLIIDGLMGADILPDDDPSHNPIVIKQSIPNAGKDELVIIIETATQASLSSALDRIGLNRR